MPLRALVPLCVALVAYVCLASTALGATVTVNGVTYTTSASPATTATVTGHTGALPSNVAIPITITSGGFNYNVTSIGSNAFTSATSLTSITIPNSVTSIGSQAFSNATNLAAITLGNSVTSIGSDAFSGARNLTSIAIPDSVTSIGTRAFYGTNSLTSVTLPANQNFTSIGSQVFYGAFNLNSITIPASVTSIGAQAFYACSSLTSITLPNGVTSIGTEAFRGTGLTSIAIPNSVTSIETAAFGAATHLATISVGADNQNYAAIDGVLFTINRATLVQYPIGSGDSTYTVPNSVTGINYGAFYGASNLTRITMPDSLTSVGEYSFGGMTALARIEFLGNQPTCNTCTGVLVNSTNATVYRFASNVTWPSIGTTYQGRPQAYLVLPTAAPTAVAGDASATVTVTAPAAGPTPDTYTVAAVSDGSKTCTVTAPATSCIVNGLTNGTSYTFTAVVNTTTPTASSRASDASNAVTPTAPNPRGEAAATPSTTLATIPLTTKATTTSTRIATTFVAPGPGIVRQVGTTSNVRSRTRAASLTVCTATKTITKAGKTTISCNLTKAAKRARGKNALKVTLTTTFTPPSGAHMVSTTTIRLARTPGKARA